MSTGSERWAQLRDREAVGEPLSEQDLHELEMLELTDPAARAYAGQMRELEGYLDGGDIGQSKREILLPHRLFGRGQRGDRSLHVSPRQQQAREKQLA